MFPVLFEAGPVTLYSYGLMIAVGIVAGMTWLIIEGRREVGLTFDQANGLFLVIFLAAVVGGKLFLFLEDPDRYTGQPALLFTGRGFVFYGSFLLAVPAMWVYFRKHRLPPYRMLDVMAVTTCFVHVFGRIGCFLAGCCYGKPTGSHIGVVFTDPSCYAEPLHTPLYPVQLMEAASIAFVSVILFRIRKTRRFYGQLFLIYLALYAVCRFVLEYFRGDVGRGFVITDYLSYGQFTALCILGVVCWVYIRRLRLSEGKVVG